MLGATTKLKEQMITLRISEMAKALDDFLLEAETKEFSYQELFYSNSPVSDKPGMGQNLAIRNFYKNLLSMNY